MIRCCFCVSRFENPSSFRDHMDSVHTSVDRSLAVLLRSKERSLIRADITNLSCRCSVKIFPTVESLANHLISEHDFRIDTNQQLGIVPLKLDSDRYDCFICSKKFPSLCPLYRHAGTHFTRHICRTCGKHFETQRCMLAHVKDCKPTSIRRADRNTCAQCKKTFPSAAERIKHKNTSKSCLYLKCNTCEERFPTWNKREQHLVEVHGKHPKVYPCTECDMTFTKRSLLYTHFKGSHTEENKCSYCHATFTLKQSLQEHIRRHTGERPYECLVCKKTFRDAKTFKYHTIIHDDSKKFKCLACSTLFVVKRRLRSHIQKHHPGF